MISLFKLINGDEVLAKIVEHDSEHYLLEDPVQMYKNVAPNGMTWIQCSHWLLYSESSLVEVEKRNVIATISDLNQDVVKNYEEFIQVGWEEHMQKMAIKLEQERAEQLEEMSRKVKEKYFNNDKDKETIH